MRPQRAARWCLLFSLIGLGLCGYLFYLHLGLLRGELLGGAACSSGGVFNCHVVTASPWGTVLGVPLALWGMLGYVAVVALALLAQQSDEWAQHAITLICALSVAFVLIDLLLLILMVSAIKFFCFFCLLSDAVNLLLVVASERGLRGSWSALLRRLPLALRSLAPSAQRPAAWLFWGVLLIGLLAGGGLHAATVFVNRGTVGSLRSQIREFVSKQERVSVNIAGDPMLGPAATPLRMVEFSDFFCPACQRASQLNAVIIAGHPRELQFIFKHFPLDTSCNAAIGRMVHPGACAVAAAAECAHLQGKFWPFHDLVFATGHLYDPARLEQDAARLGLDVPRLTACLSSGEGMEAVKRDIAEGARLGVSSTPTYVINGIRMAGGMNPSTFNDVAAVIEEQGKR